MAEGYSPRDADLGGSCRSIHESCAMKCGQVGLFLNSIEMMASGRCGRRKQRNPKRKNVENGEETDDIEEGALDDNKNKIIGSDVDTEDENTNNGTTQEIPDTQTADDAKPVPARPQTTEEKVTAILKEIQSAAPDSTSDSEKYRSKRKQSDDPRIAELLNRRDTAVIYPEPVEDGLDQQCEGSVSDEEEVVLKCMHCSQTFLRAIVLRDHMREMHADKPLKFMCPKCDETFHQKSQLDKHLTLHSPTSQNCSVCNKTFANVYRLQRHMISHNESTDLRKFKCPTCGKAFKFKHHLKEHVRIHSGEKPFVCNNCGKRFSHSGSFSSHTTSKKCWGLSAHKTRLGGEGVQNHAQTTSQTSSQGMGLFGQKLPLAFPGNKLPSQFDRTPLQTVPISLAHQQHFLPAMFSQQKGGTSYFYPPPVFATPDGFLQPVFSVSQSIPTSLQQQHSLNLTTKPPSHDTEPGHTPTHPLATPSLAGRSPRSLSPLSQSTRSFSPHSHSGRSVSPISSSYMSSPPSHPRRSVTPSSQPSMTPSSEHRRSMTPGSESRRSETPSCHQHRSETPSSQHGRPVTPCSESARSVTPITPTIHPGQSSTPTSHPVTPSHHARSMTPSSQPSMTAVTPVSVRARSHSPQSHSAQISPDVNSNTKLLVVDSETATSSDQPCEATHNTDTVAEVDIKIEQPETSTEQQEQPESTNDTTNHDQTSKDCDPTTTDSDQTKSALACHHCDEVFESPVLQHQHERFMCKQNKDIVHQRSQSEPCQSPHSTMSDISHAESSYQNDHGSDDEDVDELYKDVDVSFEDKKMRIRSLFTEEQQSFLKSQYVINPRPKKHVLIQIGNKLGFPKRVIQVWFQNMRARERKQGREQSLGLPPVKVEHGKDNEVSKPSTYIPNVPKPFPNLLSMRSLSNGPVPGELPLDLSVRKSPPLAHGGMSRLSTPDRSGDDQALNLSVKKDSSTERESSIESQTSSRLQSPSLQTSSLQSPSLQTSSLQAASLQQHQKTLQDSVIFKYMQQEGLIQNKSLPPHITSTMSPSLALQNHIFHQSMASVLKMPAYSTSTDPKSNNSVLFDSPTSTSNSRLDHDNKLIIDEGPSELAQSPKTAPASGSQVLLHVPLTDARLHEAAHHNLTTLAEAAQHAANILSGKPKRVRKKTWRQMEAEEVQLELEDSLSTDEDNPAKKRRKSWKSHRVERDEGMYACDQCNKVFSKQSSLARHKYEHSGARPFACDLCSKSFKHKHHLTEHKRLHSGEKPFQCKKCGKRFSHSGSFSQHMNHRFNYCSPHKTSDGDGDCELSSQDSP